MAKQQHGTRGMMREREDWQPGLKYSWETGQALPVVLTSSNLKEPWERGTHTQQVLLEQEGPRVRPFFMLFSETLETLGLLTPFQRLDENNT